MKINFIEICFTGHRPDKLPNGDIWSGPKNKRLMKFIEKQIIDLLDTYENIKVTVGGALGIDQMAFAICYKLKEKYPNRITIHIAIPFDSEIQTGKWTEKQKQRYYRHIELCDKLIQVDKQLGYQYLGCGFHIRKLQLRNEYMVNNSDIVIAVWDGTTGGTYNCIRYAREGNKKILFIDPNTLQTKKENF